MGGLQLFVFVLLYTGAYFLISRLLGLKSIKEMKKRLRQYHKKESFRNIFDRLAVPLARVISRYIDLPQYRHDSLLRDLQRAGIPLTPQMYYGMAISKGLLIELCVIPSLIAGIPIISIALVVLGVLFALRELEMVKEKLKELNASILRALPSFVRSVTESLKSDKNFQRIFEKYIENVPDTPLKTDLNKLIARLGANENKEQALRQFETTLNNDHLRSFVNALIEVSRDGADQQYYFDSANHQMGILNRENIRRTVGKRPHKIKRATFAMMACAILVFIYPVIMQLIQGMTLFQ